jgi:hypothetical protein
VIKRAADGGTDVTELFVYSAARRCCWLPAPTGSLVGIVPLRDHCRLNRVPRSGLWLLLIMVEVVVRMVPAAGWVVWAASAFGCMPCAVTARSAVRPRCGQSEATTGQYHARRFAKPADLDAATANQRGPWAKLPVLALSTSHDDTKPKSRWLGEGVPGPGTHVARPWRRSSCRMPTSWWDRHRRAL